MVHFFAAFLKARYIIFLIDSSFGKTPLFLIILRIWRLTDSIELVVVLEVDTSHAESLLSSCTDWEDVKLEKDLVERNRYIVARK